MPDVSAFYGTLALTSTLVTGTTYYLSLHSTDPGILGVNEISGGSYARQAITFSNPFTPTGFPSGLQESVSSQTFTNMPAVSGNLWFGIFDAPTSGDYLIGGTSAAVTGPIIAASTVDFAANAIVIFVT